MFFQSKIIVLYIGNRNNGQNHKFVVASRFVY